MEAISCLQMKLNISFPATGCTFTDVNDEHKCPTFWGKHIDIEVAADALGEWEGYVGQISGGNDKQGFSIKHGGLTHGHVYHYWGRSNPVIDQREMEKGNKICSELHSECQCECSQLGYCKNEIFLILLCLTAWDTCTLTPAKKTAKSANFSVTKEDDVYQYVVRNPLNKEGMKPRTIVHKIQYFVALCALQHRYWHNTLKK